MTFTPDSGSRPLAERQRVGDDRLIGATLALSALYATVRYNVFKGVPWSDWPHFIGNKILAIASLILIALAVLRLIFQGPQPIRRLMAWGGALAAIHTALSLALCRPEYFDKFFVGPKLSIAGGLSFLLASIALVLLNLGKGKGGSVRPEESARALATIAFLSGLHAALPSISSWFDPAKWPGALPPITLLSFLIGLAALVAVQVNSWRKRRSSISQAPAADPAIIEALTSTNPSATNDQGWTTSSDERADPHRMAIFR